ncbi:hypothetical protein [Nocardia sp. CY41]|uniref:hypothetical protein n=1 Tax=Nocardia sp. CY41 TaxID=2608686 RepID=UPI00135BB922|nr:hypothetical protein [Nocardia sp. CY41]
MARKPLLSDDAVREIQRLHADRYPVAEIARKYDRSLDAIYNLLRGKSYRDVTASSHGTRTCACADCATDRRRDENVRRGDLIAAVAVCVRCGEDFTTKATAMLARPGYMVCPSCREERP